MRNIGAPAKRGRKHGATAAYRKMAQKAQERPRARRLLPLAASSRAFAGGTWRPPLIANMQGPARARDLYRRDATRPRVERRLLVTEDRGALGDRHADVIEVALGQGREPAAINRRVGALGQFVKNSFHQTDRP